ncbi:MAG: mandelate racemase/muconate lactonizing enzyme family protein [Thaumarchaeota archaeon]|nr:mandelate racemase/muconate lactonizing enzyme family protein [Nitrososphaerota archaeon]
MKISDLRVAPTAMIKLQSPGMDSMHVVQSFRTSAIEIVTDEGITGIAPFGFYGFEATKAIIETELKPEILGENPLDHERIWEKMYWQTVYYGRKGVAIYAMGVIDTAIWDLKGKILNVPCYRLLGGFGKRVPVYRTGFDFGLGQAELVKFHQSSVEKGFPAVKMKVGRRDDQEDIDRVKAVRDGIGFKTKLLVDANQGWSVSQAKRMARKLERFEVFWLEEPTLADNLDGLASIAEATEIPLALGEAEYTKFGFKELLQRKAVGVIIGDVPNVGGVTEWKKIAAMAQSYGIPVSPQNFDLCGASALASIPNGLYLEFQDVKPLDWSKSEIWQNQLLVQPTPKIEKGEIELGEKPGFGWELGSKAFSKKGSVQTEDEWVRHSTTPPGLPRSKS